LMGLRGFIADEAEKKQDLTGESFNGMGAG
jgi:hypothetical protein